MSTVVIQLRITIDLGNEKVVNVASVTFSLENFRKGPVELVGENGRVPRDPRRKPAGVLIPFT
jgi:hypothetical protein